MLLSEIVFIKENISKHEEEMHDLAKIKGSRHPEVLKARKQLDDEIIMFRKKILKQIS
ncbi:hypothetical protein QYG89_13595 [Bacillus sp. B190/17]|uniref:Aspartyl-phosphate phosphatase Spo0E family protein n=1 Tax=Bacillus lumedeiriae TaxID=3058829 RepID=A0ABW8IBY9_9BACI